jgi:hypothetical protein
VQEMSDKLEKLTLPDNLYNEMLKFFRRTSLPRIQRQREQEKAQKDKKTLPSGNKR